MKWKKTSDSTVHKAIQKHVVEHAERDKALKMLRSSTASKKVQIGTDQEMTQSERNSHSINRGVGKTKMTLKYLYHENMS